MSNVALTSEEALIKLNKSTGNFDSEGMPWYLDPTEYGLIQTACGVLTETVTMAVNIDTNAEMLLEGPLYWDEGTTIDFDIVLTNTTHITYTVGRGDEVSDVASGIASLCNEVAGINSSHVNKTTISESTVLINGDNAGIVVTVSNIVVDTGAGPISAEVQAVFDRMSALTSTERDAIETFVDAMVSAGYYSDITEVYAPCLNATDYKTGFKFMSLIDSTLAPVHTAGEFVEFSANAMHFLDSADFDTFANPEGFAGVYNVFTGADTVNNSDLFGVADLTNECYYRWRGTDTTDFNAIYNVSSGTPRSANNIRPTGDLVGLGLDGIDVFELAPGGIVVKSTRTPTAVPVGFPFQWHGQNINGTPASGNVANSRYSMMMHSNALLSAIAQGSLRALALQFLRDIGVTGVPVT